MIKTDGDDAVVSLLELFIQAAENSLRESLGGSTLGVFSNGNETDLDKVTGMQTILSTSTTTGTVGNLNRATLTVWRHQSGNASGAFDTNGLNVLRTAFRQARRFDEAPDIIVVTGSFMDNFERELTSTFQVNLPLTVGAGDQTMLDAGFVTQAPSAMWNGWSLN